jgi:phosphoribosylformylglycinamidine (FGAM) synthase-like amidotransferase family enzyme
VTADGSAARGTAHGRDPANPNGSVDDVAGLTDVSAACSD